MTPVTCLCGAEMVRDHPRREWLCQVRVDGERHGIDHAALSRKIMARYPKIIAALSK